MYRALVVSKNTFLKQSLLGSKSLIQAPIRLASGDVLKDKEKGDERIFFTKQDGKFAL